MGSEWKDSQDEALSYKTLSAQEAKELQERSPKLVWWKVLVIQLLSGLAVVFIALFWYERSGVVLCAVAGVMAAWVPSVFATGWLQLRHGKKLAPSVFLMELYFIEFIKVILTIALLVMAFVWIRPLAWLPLLAGFVVTVKAYGIVCWLLLNQHKD